MVRNESINEGNEGKQEGIREMDKETLTQHEWGFIQACLNSLRYDTINAKDEQEYNDKIYRIVKKISRIRGIW